MENAEMAVAATQRWFERFVVELDLCPFARHAAPYISVTSAREEQTLLEALAAEIEALMADDHRETTLLVIPDMLDDFLLYNDFLGVCDELLAQSNLEGHIQLASFHPLYQFADTQPNDPENFANRSPFPMLHILREASVSDAVDGHPDVSQIPVANRAALEKIGTQALQERWLSCFSD